MCLQMKYNIGKSLKEIIDEIIYMGKMIEWKLSI